MKVINYERESMMLPMIRKRLFDDSPAVVWRGKVGVVLDRDLLPTHKANGERYPLSACKHRWIEYTDNPACPRYYGEWNVYRSKREAIAEAVKADAVLCAIEY